MHVKEGCTVQRPFDEINKHEKSCSFRKLTCHCFLSGSLVDLKTHYEKEHHELVIKEGDPIEVGEGVTSFLLITRSLYFFANCTFGLNNFSLEVVSLLDIFNEWEPIFKCKLYGYNLDFKIELNVVTKLLYTEKPPTFILNSEIPIECMNDILSNIICPHCSIQMTPPILKCLRGEHVICVGCIDATFDYCKICQRETDLECDSKLECLAAILTFLCKWDCGSIFNAMKIREHEHNCEKRLYRCCHYWGCEWEGQLSELAIHEETCMADDTTCRLFFDQAETIFLSNELDFIEIHLFTHKCHFDVTHIREDGRTIVTVRRNDLYAVGRFRYEADLIHIDDPKSPINKTYKVNNSSGSCCSLIVPEEDILKFGKDRPFKIKVRIILLNKEERKIETDLLFKHFINYQGLLL